MPGKGYLMLGNARESVDQYTKIFPLSRCSSGVRESAPVAVTYYTDDIRSDNGTEAADGRSSA